jgi:hypothetical protein
MTTSEQPLVMDDPRLLLRIAALTCGLRNIAASAIQSYLTVGENLLKYLAEKGTPTTAGGVHREHLEAFLADLRAA